jgi:hypothetical protein
MVIGRGRRREHPMDTSKGSRDLRSLRMLHNFRLRTLKGNPEGIKWPSVAMLLLLICPSRYATNVEVVIST